MKNETPDSWIERQPVDYGPQPEDACPACSKIDCVCPPEPPKRACILCGQLTEGSVGAAGIHWSSICQVCKNAEDSALRYQLEAMKFIDAKLFDNLSGGQNLSYVESACDWFDERDKERGLEANPYSYEEHEARQREQIET